MKIALLTDGIYPFVIGGMQRHSYYLAKFFAKHRIHIDLYHTNNGNLDIERLDCFTGEEKKYIHSIVIQFPKSDGLPGHYLRSSFKYSEKIFEIYKTREKVDFIYAKGFTAWKFLKEKKRGYQTAPIGINFHGYEMFQPPPDFKAWLQQKLIFRRPVLFNMKHSDYLFSYGGKITTIIKKLIPDHHKIIEIPSGIEEKWLTDKPIIVNDPIRFIFIGRYERRKGIEELNAVLKKMKVTHSFTFTFIGPIPTDKQLKQSNFFYKGEITDVNTIQKYLRESDVLVCPSHSEGMPNVILEAMASGLCIIASDVGAVSKLVNNQNGILILPGNSEELRQAILTLIAKKVQALIQMKLKSKEKIENDFLWEKIILKTIHEIKQRLRR